MVPDAAAVISVARDQGMLAALAPAAIWVQMSTIGLGGINDVMAPVASERPDVVLLDAPLDYQTLRNYAWVARGFASSRRRDTLSFGHHAEVAALPEPEQDYWLRQAEEHHWPVKQLRHQVHNSLSERSRSQHNPSAQTEDRRDWVILRLQLRLTADQLQTCQAAANNASLSLETWTILAVEHAARHELTATGMQQPPQH